MSIELEKRGAVAVMTFNRPEKLNAMTSEMRQQMEQRLIEVRDDPGVRALVMTGAGKAFCTGGDIRTFASSTPAAMRDRIKQQHRVTLSLYHLEKPVIVAVNGAAFGSGFNLALLGDIILASDSARFCQSYSKVAIVPDGGGLYLLSRIVGAQKAKELVLLAEVLNARQAKELGIVREVYPDDRLMAEAMKLAESLAAGPTRAFGLDKSLLNRGWAMDLEGFLELEAVSEAHVMQTADHQEGVAAFKENRKPIFKGE